MPYDTIRVGCVVCYYSSPLGVNVLSKSQQLLKRSGEIHILSIFIASRSQVVLITWVEL